MVKHNEVEGGKSNNTIIEKSSTDIRIFEIVNEVFEIEYFFILFLMWIYRSYINTIILLIIYST